jgi:hypothetical protein
MNINSYKENFVKNNYWYPLYFSSVLINHLEMFNGKEIEKNI